ncbi:limonene-1%2C2-epoxide hydrolase [Mycobacterium tuberculosis]|nr:limonene-1,2-epoxide hydrolase [Mycobacterium tuberculosis]CKP80067.1 limonene-1%2C2-epoxide hydrolase [Mycobacterium tuberculosis]
MPPTACVSALWHTRTGSATQPAPAAALARHPVGHPPQIPATERTETPTFGPLRIRFWACGIFEVQRARYGITTSASKALVRGLTASAFSSPRATL